MQEPTRTYKNRQTPANISRICTGAGGPSNRPFLRSTGRPAPSVGRCPARPASGPMAAGFGNRGELHGSAGPAPFGAPRRVAQTHHDSLHAGTTPAKAVRSLSGGGGD